MEIGRDGRRRGTWEGAGEADEGPEEKEAKDQDRNQGSSGEGAEEKLRARVEERSQAPENAKEGAKVQ